MLGENSAKDCHQRDDRKSEEHKIRKKIEKGITWKYGKREHKKRASVFFNSIKCYRRKCNV